MHRSASHPALITGVLLLAIACGNDPVAPPTTLSRAPASRAFTATDLPVALLDPGTLQFLPQRIIWHNLLLRARFTASDPRFTGTLEGPLKAEWTLAGEGPVWGRFTLAVDEGGQWDIIWTGHRSRTGPAQWTGEATWTARGIAGRVEGLQASGRETITTTELIPSSYVGEISGAISGTPLEGAPAIRDP